MGVLCLSLFCNTLLCVHSCFAIILKTTRKLVALLLLSNGCIVTMNGLFVCLFLLLYVSCQQLWSLRDGQFT